MFSRSIALNWHTQFSNTQHSQTSNLKTQTMDRHCFWCHLIRGLSWYLLTWGFPWQYHLFLQSCMWYHNTVYHPEDEEDEPLYRRLYRETGNPGTKWIKWRQRQRHRDTETQTHRQTHRQTDRHTHKTRVRRQDKSKTNHLETISIR